MCLSLFHQTTKLKAMKALQLIHYIASHPEYKIIVIDGDDDRTPMQAIECISGDTINRYYRINGTLEEGTLLIY